MIAPSGREAVRFPYALILFSVVLSAVSEVLLKIGADRTAQLTSPIPGLGVSALASGWTWFGIINLIAALIAWLFALRYIPLNIAYNLGGLVHVFVPLSCWLMLGESINLVRWTGIALVLLGVWITAKPLMRMEQEMEVRL